MCILRRTILVYRRTPSPCASRWQEISERYFIYWEWERWLFKCMAVVYNWSWNHIRFGTLMGWQRRAVQTRSFILWQEHFTLLGYASWARLQSILSPSDEELITLCWLLLCNSTPITQPRVPRRPYSWYGTIFCVSLGIHNYKNGYAKLGERQIKFPSEFIELEEFWERDAISVWWWVL